VGYRYVEEKAVSETGVPLGKTAYSFMGPLESPDVLYRNSGNAAGFTYYDAPNPPADRRDWLRGLLTRQVDYRFDTVTQTYSEVRKIDYTYKKMLEPVSKGLQVNIVARNLVNGQHSLLFTYYNHYSGTILLEKTEETLFQDNGTFKTTTTIENSGKSFLPVSKSIAQSDGSLFKEYYTYPKEYAPGNAAIDNLIKKNIVSVPIETVKLKEQPKGTFAVTGGSLTNYYPTGWGKVQSVSVLETNLAIPVSTFKFSNAPAGQLPTSRNASQFAADARYKTRILFNSYDAYGNPTEKQKVNDVKEVYLWGYNGAYPVAKVVGSDYATVSGLINQSMLDNANAYTDAQVRTELNKIRTWFAKSSSVSVSTYTYAPLIGMTSQTDANNVSTFYQYDSFGRLVLVRDQNNKILKMMEYRYAGQ
jgi:YD repeat-containing protein